MKGWKLRNSILLPVLSLFAAGEAAELNGKVSDEAGKVVDYASIRIYTPDTVLIAGVVCDENGCYSATGLPASEVLVSAGCIGYETAWAKAALRRDRPAQADFTLVQRANELAEVTVTTGAPCVPR